MCLQKNWSTYSDACERGTAKSWVHVWLRNLYWQRNISLKDRLSVRHVCLDHHSDDELVCPLWWIHMKVFTHTHFKPSQPLCNHVIIQSEKTCKYQKAQFMVYLSHKLEIQLKQCLKSRNEVIKINVLLCQAFNLYITFSRVPNA